MKKDTNIIIRIDSEMKKKVTEFLDSKGYTISDSINGYFKYICDKNALPLQIYKYMPKKSNYGGILTLSFIKKSIKEIIEQYGREKIKKVYLFGSYSRGDCKPSSDVDIRIEPGPDLTLFDIGNIRLTLQDKLKKSVDLVASRKEYINPTLLANIMEDEICLYE